MNLGILNDRLSQAISRFGSTAIETRQIAKRMHGLLPARLMEIKREYARRFGGGKAERHALADERFVRHIEDYTEVQAQALEARIQYETHAMLFKARQTLRAFRNRPEARDARR
jgi:hypothetical protein